MVVPVAVHAVIIYYGQQLLFSYTGTDDCYHATGQLVLFPDSASVGTGRLYGGQLVAHAVMAAQAVIDDPDFLLHTVHCFFMAPVRNSSFVYKVEKLKIGRQLCYLCVRVTHMGKEAFCCLVSFSKVDPVSPQLYHSSYPMPAVPHPSSEVRSNSSFTLREYIEIRATAMPMRTVYCLPHGWQDAFLAGKMEPRYMKLSGIHV